MSFPSLVYPPVDRALKAVAGAGRALVDLVLPPRCLGCGGIVADASSICGPCWSRQRFITDPLCVRCGHPLPHAMRGALDCAACRRTLMTVDRARSAMAYDEASRGMILSFKHGGRIDAAALFAGWMAEAGRDMLAAADIVVPVPLHRWRLLRRGYNQAALLANGVAKLARLPHVPDLLIRAQATRSQQGLGGRARGVNITAASFRLGRQAGSRIAGKRVVLIDDVLTTGATLAACTAVLRRGGALRVDALTLARVVRDDGHPI